MKKKAIHKSKSPMPSKSPSQTPKSSILRNKKPTTTITAADSKSSLASIADLKDMTVSRFRDVKSSLIDHSHSEILKDLEAFQSRLHKRFKIQSQTCQKMMDEAETDFKKISERINESCEAMIESYEEITADTQASASRLCKTTIPELVTSFDKAINTLQGRFGIPST